MSTQFEFRLLGVEAPEGQLEADHLLALVRSLKEVATKIGRAETDAEPVGRAPHRVHRVSRLSIGLAPGSTTLLVRRAGAGQEAFNFDLVDERAFDERFQALVESIADDERPDWVDDSLALATEELTAALQQAAREVQFRAAGRVRRAFSTDQVHRETWRANALPTQESVTFVGRLFAVNLNTHRLQVQDDVGNQVALPQVPDDAPASRLIGAYVTVTGTPERDARGRLAKIRDAAVAAAPDPLGQTVPPTAVPLDEILQSVPGPDPDGGIELTDEEFASFLKAARG